MKKKYTQLFEAQQLSESSKSEYGSVVYHDSTVAKRYILRYSDLQSFGKAWNLVKKLESVRGNLEKFEITVSIYVPFEDYLEEKSEEE